MSELLDSSTLNPRTAFAHWAGLGHLVQHRHRQFLEYLRNGEWVAAVDLPDQAKLKLTLLRHKWIEAREADGKVSYRITASGIAEMSKPTRLR
ncbi:hypothetical protein [Bradyrhizobium sp. 33ap4]|uniref:hypothetical protein n=1 Tax=Bradyrhizobium sp. 33ap4 TaxID=3061630 RepID=UPI00292EA280|nr:hypothetical protein [Bradyrhizobium sp. 33ap4]